MVRMAGSLVSGEETDTINLSLEMTATPETPISHFLRRSPDKYSTPILSNMIPLAFAGDTDTGDDTNHIPISRGNYKPTTHHATTPSNNPTTLTNQPPTTTSKDTKRTTPPPLPAAKDRRRSRCSYVGNVCNLHDPGARLKWRPTGKTGDKTKLGRKYYHECDIGIEGQKMFQPKMFSLLTPRNNLHSKTLQRTFTTHSVGQIPSVAQTGCRAGINPYEDRTRGEKSGAGIQARR